jgi:hypothetical protein
MKSMTIFSEMERAERMWLWPALKYPDLHLGVEENHKNDLAG